MINVMTPAMAPGWLRLLWPIFKLVMRDDGGKAAQKSSVYAASSSELAEETGIYLDTNSKRMKWGKDILDERNCKEIWGRLEQVTGLESTAFQPSTAFQSAAKPGLTL
jgi:hypothetical protein